MKKSFFRTNHIKEHEKRQAKRRETLGFKEFVIHRFLIILLYVVISEYIVKSLLDEFMIPVMQQWGFENIDLDASLSFSEVFLFLIIFVMIVLFVTPLIIASFWFSRIIVNEVDRMEENKEALRKDYEEKRNLMLSDIAHDLRTPITTIAGYSKALNDGMVTDEEKKREYLQAIKDKSERMSALINLLFEYAKLDSTGFELKWEIYNLPELLRKNAALLYSDVEDEGMELEISIPEEVCLVKLDSLQFSRVITNLISNAIRHNRSGTTIFLEMTKKEEEIFIVVSDNGTEIPKEVAEHIFEPFIVGDASRKTKGGSGLGLSIVKKIVDKHGWKIEFRQNEPEYKKAFIIKINLQE